jgi:hypothetical protein
MGAFTRYYHVQDILKNIEAERIKAAEDKNYIQKYVVGTPASIATVSGERALILQNRLDRGVNNIAVRPPDEDTQYTAADLVTQVGIGLLNVPNAIGQVVDQAASTFDPEITTLENRIQDNLYKIIPKMKGQVTEFLPWVGVGPRYNEVERDLRKLITEYDKAGYQDMAINTLERLKNFYLNYPERLDKNDILQQAAIREQITRNSNWLWMGDNFAKASQVFNSAELAAMVDERIRTIQSQRAYAEQHTDLTSRARAQQRTTHEITAAGLFNDLQERITREVPSIQSIRDWVSANRTNSVYLDAYNEDDKRVMSDIIINFNTNGRTIHTIRMPNNYNLRRDVNLDRVGGIDMRHITDALEALDPTQQGVTR